MPATAVETHTFIARGRSERLVRQPLLFTETSLGRRIQQQGAVRYEFAPDGRLDLVPGQDLIADGPVDPSTGQPTVQDAIAWLDSHPLLNTRFWHEGYEPGRLLPTEDDFLEQVTAAVAGLQVEPIEVLLASERAGHNRSLLVKAAERSLRQVRATLAAIAEQSEAGASDVAVDGSVAPKAAAAAKKKATAA